MAVEGLLSDLHSGDWGTAVPKLRRCLSAAVRAAGMLSPSGSAKWSQGELDDLTQDFLVNKNGPARLAQLAINATSEEQCARLLNRTIRNFLADRARKDPRPKLRRSLRTICLTEASLNLVGDLVTNGQTPLGAAGFAGDEGDLLRAGKRVEVPPPPWDPRAEREGPPTTRAGLVALCHAILDEAGTALRIATLTAVIADRLEVRRAWDDLFDPELEGPPRPATDRATPVSADARAVAREIWDALDDTERELVTHVGVGGRTAVAETDINLGKSATQKHLEHLKDKLVDALAGVADADGVATALFDIHASWKKSGGRPGGVVRKSQMRGGGAPHLPKQNPGAT